MNDFRQNELVQSDPVRKLIWAGLRGLIGALASIAAMKAAEAIYERVFNEEPPV
jgi:hypothetical protein